MVGRSLGRALLAIAALVCVCLSSRSARAEWHAHASGLRYWLPTQWPTAPLEAGTIARGAGGVAVWVLPLNAAQLVTASAPEALLARVVTRPRLLSRASSISPLIATGRWSHGTATF